MIAHIKENGFIQELEVKLKRKNQENFDALMSMYPSEHEGIESFIVWISDITERKRAQEELADALSVIRESVDYASNIQRSTLLGEGDLAAAAADHFIIWEPRDVVGGDVVWLRRCDGGTLIAVCDCTGHGVPGAFMTLIATATLNRSLRETPSGQLDELMRCINNRIKTVLGQDTEDAESDDGMDVGMVFFDDGGESRARSIDEALYDENLFAVRRIRQPGHRPSKAIAETSHCTDQERRRGRFISIHKHPCPPRR